LWLELKLQTRI
jgi:hypothetical protein